MGTRISTAIAAASIAVFAGGRAFGFDASTVDGAVAASNFVCSPAGAAVALTMLAAGAHGETQAEMFRLAPSGSTVMQERHGESYRRC
jgi:serine protease inhibitor